jgi:hypothetical protein
MLSLLPKPAARWLSGLFIAAAAFAAVPAVASATEDTHVPGEPAPAVLLTYTAENGGLTSSASPLTSGLAQAYAFTKAMQWWHDNIRDDDQDLLNLDWGAFSVTELGTEDWEVDGFVYNKYDRYYCFIPWEVTRSGPTTVHVEQLFAAWCHNY